MADQENIPSERIPGRDNRSRRASLMLAALLIVVGGMFAFAYANAEYFVFICQRVGLISAPAGELRTDAAGAGTATGRPLDVYFSASVNDNLPISCSVESKFQKSRVGGTTVNFYRFTNQSDRVIYFKPVHDVFPARAGLPDALILTKCFCFDLQKIDPNQSYTLPVEYTFTESIGESTRVIRMSYSIFPSTREDYDAWMAGAEEREKEAAAARAAQEAAP